ncbi:hypothetical protein O181_118036 [Austropuccinia psidii MF-1]|uniref:Uncharacterized protein n=1 Tax=Austropuccinia psidii MF-1 TaxID=1389203 RepID=A0A9Q3KDT5_9BASI|nr:hypothetical protein [Austropuccinia psidii MF-1]
MEHSFRIVSHPLSASDSLASAESFHWTQELQSPLCSVQPSIGANTPASHSVPSPPIRTLHTSTIGHFPCPSIFTQNFPTSSRSSSILHPSKSNSSGKIVELSAEHWEAKFAKIGNHFLDQKPWQGKAMFWLVQCSQINLYDQLFIRHQTVLPSRKNMMFLLPASKHQLIYIYQNSGKNS